MKEKYPTALNTELTIAYWQEETRSAEDPERRRLGARLIANIAVREVLKSVNRKNGGDAS